MPCVLMVGVAPGLAEQVRQHRRAPDCGDTAMA